MKRCTSLVDLPKIKSGLMGKPGLGALTERNLKPYSHLGTDRSFAVHDLGKRFTRHVERLGGTRHGQIQRI